MQYAMVFGPRSYGAIEGIDVGNEQGMQMIDNLMRTLRTPGNGQSMVKVFLVTFQHVSGCQQPLLQFPKQRAPHLEGYFYPYLRQFLADNESSLEVACVKPLQTEREDDRFLMDIACEDNTLDTTTVNKINYCRLFLEVHRISDICTADGNFISDSVYIGQRSYGSSASRVIEAVQERPEMKSWGIWRIF